MTTDRPDHRARNDAAPLVDAALDAAWRAHSREAPSSDLDAAILAAAHRASRGGPRDPALAEAREPERWWWPLAAAAVIGAFSFGVLQLLPQDDTGSGSVVSDMPHAPSAAVPAPAASTDTGTRAARPQAAESAPAGPAPRPVEDAARPQGPAAPAMKTERSQPAQPRAEPGPRREPRAFPGTSSAAPDTPLDQPSRRDAPASATVGGSASVDRPAPSVGASSSLAHPSSRASPPKNENRARESTVRSDQDAASTAGVANANAWIKRIRAYRAEGRESDAQAELRRFRAADPDADRRLPDDLRAWAASVPR